MEQVVRAGSLILVRARSLACISGVELKVLWCTGLEAAPPLALSGGCKNEISPFLFFIQNNMHIPSTIRIVFITIDVGGSALSNVIPEHFKPAELRTRYTDHCLLGDVRCLGQYHCRLGMV